MTNWIDLTQLIHNGKIAGSVYSIFHCVSKVIFIWTRVAKFNLFVSNRMWRRKHSRRVCAISLQYAQWMELRLASVMKSNHVQLCQCNYLCIPSINYVMVLFLSLSLFHPNRLDGIRLLLFDIRLDSFNKVYCSKCVDVHGGNWPIRPYINARTHTGYSQATIFIFFSQFTCI